ncbi:IS3 family transposase [Cytobacillus sp. FSL R5-0596]|uniref:IS3 family transposase n=1 Tax=Cytobacillus sp. FSL R5-0596 TaxID=2954696 RepID=UPI004046F4EA
MNPEFGRPRMTDELNENGYLINHKRVYRLMTEMDIQSVIRKKRKWHGSSFLIALKEISGLQDLIKRW